jgi:hypothetical protein
MTRLVNAACLWAVIAMLVSVPALQAQETGAHAALRKEWKSIESSCSSTDQNGRKKSLKERVPGCGQAIFTGNKGIFPSVATFPPMNGLALGMVVKDNELPTTNWRLSWQVNAQASFNSSWTSGAFLRMQHAPSGLQKPTVVLHAPTSSDSGRTETLVLNLYAFHTALRQLTFYGIGPFTTKADRTFFSFAETITGIDASQPLSHGFYLLGELNGRWPDVEGRHGESSPSIEQTFAEANTPGLIAQPGFLQVGIGAQFSRSFGHAFALDYTAKLQQYSAVNDSRYSFRRFLASASHDIYPTKRFSGRPIGRAAPEGATTTERIARITLRGWLVESIAPAGHNVPFYFQPTLGGTDIDKQHFLPSYPDYRYRAPNMFLLRGEYEQPLPKFSFLGAIFRADSGRVAATRGDLDFSHLRHSFGAGITIRAGNVPYVMLMYAWGGREGTHFVTDINMSAISPSGGTASLW